jgi:hypothetical protein
MIGPGERSRLTTACTGRASHAGERKNRSERNWMHKWRSIVLLAATAAGFAASFVPLQRVLGASSPWLGLLGMFYLLGLSKVAEPLFLLRMPSALRAIRRSEIDGALYRRLLVPSFGKLLRDTPLRYLNLDVYLTRKQPDLTRLSRQAEAAEASHFWAALLFTPYIGYVWWAGHRWEAALFLLVQVLGNVYPILHLRLVRGRLDRILRRRPRQQGLLSSTFEPAGHLPR